MRNFVVFLNELSCSTDIQLAEIRPHVLRAIDILIALKVIRRDLLIGSDVALSKITIGNGHTFASVLTGDDYREQWRFLAGLDNASPWDASPVFKAPTPDEEVVYDNQTAIGMTCAWKNNTAIFSFTFENWVERIIPAELRRLTDTGEVGSEAINIYNISSDVHICMFRGTLENHGHDISTSSLIYSDRNIAIRMYSNDHGTPHVHVCCLQDTAITLATMRIENLDVLAGRKNLSYSLHTSARQWVESNRAVLMENWNRCRSGKLPVSLMPN